MTHDRMPLAAHVEIYKRLRDDIAASAGLDIDDEAVRDTAEGESDLSDVLAKLLRQAREAEAFAKGIADIQRENAERKARLEAKAEKLRAIVLHAMSEADLPKLAAPDFTASRGPSRAPLRIPDEQQVPERFCRVKREPDRAAIRKAIADGEALDFAWLGNSTETLTVRSK